jgi:hypothetical protein
MNRDAHPAEFDDYDMNPDLEGTDFYEDLSDEAGDNFYA